MNDTKHGPLQDVVNLTPFDLLCNRIIIEEAVPNYFRYCCVDDGRLGACHDTPAQAIFHARRTFGVWLEDDTL